MKFSLKECMMGPGCRGSRATKGIEFHFLWAINTCLEPQQKMLKPTVMQTRVLPVGHFVLLLYDTENIPVSLVGLV